MNSRRLVLVVVFFIVFSMTACSSATNEEVSAQLPAPTNSTTSTPEPTQTLVPTATPTPTSTPTEIPPTPTKALTVSEKRILAHEQRKIRLISEQGAAEMIPVFEYHGDDYYLSFSNGAVVELGPDGFQKQMQWFYENGVHAVTGDELIKWLHGEIELPKRSVVLTFDLGNRSKEPIRRMLVVFEKYNMHGIFTIWVHYMNEGQHANCVDDACWQVFRDAHNSGLVTIGSHSITHPQFAKFSAEDGLRELGESKRIIEENIGNGCIVNTLTWPHESIPSWGSRIQEIGFEAAFGGNTYYVHENTIHRARPEDWYRLPRNMPPNSSGISGRPNGKTMEEIMSMYTSGW